MASTDPDVATWTRLLEPACADLVSAAATTDDHDASAIERLRRSWPADLVAAALQLAAARRAAARKFPHADRLVADVAGVEQATAHVVAEHKARRYRDLAPTRILDLCCGIGGDAMSLARVCAVRGIDRSPLRAWMCGQNARCATDVADVTTLDLRGEVVHLDPARRAESGPRRGRRAWRLEDYVPGVALIEDLLERCPDAAIKLGPGVDLEALPRAAATEIEMISEHGTLVQAVLWSGHLAHRPGGRTATRLPDGVTLGADAPASAPCGDGRFARLLLEPDAAAERAGLLGELASVIGAVEVHPGLGLLTADHVDTSPWVRRFEVVESMPFQPRRLRAWLRAHGAGIVEVKTRGRAADPDALQHDLRGRGDERYTVFVLRLGRRLVAVVTKRLGE